MCLFVSADVFTEAGKLEGLLAFKVGKTQRASQKKKKKEKKERKQTYVQRGRRDCPEKKVFWTRAKSAWSPLTPKKSQERTQNFNTVDTNSHTHTPEHTLM